MLNVNKTVFILLNDFIISSELNTFHFMITEQLPSFLTLSDVKSDVRSIGRSRNNLGWLKAARVSLGKTSYKLLMRLNYFVNLHNTGDVKYCRLFYSSIVKAINSISKSLVHGTHEQ